MASDLPPIVPVVPLEYAQTSEPEARARWQFRQGLLLVAGSLAVYFFADMFSFTGGMGLMRPSAGRVFTLLSLSLMAVGGWMVLSIDSHGNRRGSMLLVAIPLLVLAAAIPVTRPFVKLLMMRLKWNWAGPSAVILQTPQFLWSLACLWVFIHIWRVLRVWQRDRRHLILVAALLVCAGWFASAIVDQAWMILSTQSAGKRSPEMVRLHTLYKVFRAAAGLAAIGLAAALTTASLAMRGDTQSFKNP